MKKFLNILIVLSSLIGYLEWGTHNHSFLFQAEIEILSKIFSDPVSIIHPFTLLPLAGQIILLIPLFQKRETKFLSYAGIACLSLLFVFMLFIGLFSANAKILLSTLPFFITSAMRIFFLRKE